MDRRRFCKCRTSDNHWDGRRWDEVLFDHWHRWEKQPRLDTQNRHLGRLLWGWDILFGYCWLPIRRYWSVRRIQDLDKITILFYSRFWLIIIMNCKKRTLFKDLGSEDMNYTWLEDPKFFWFKIDLRKFSPIFVKNQWLFLIYRMSKMFARYIRILVT